MGEITEQSWWELHLRVARGETLNDEERASYEAGLQQRHAVERLDGDLASLRAARARVAVLEAEQAQLGSHHRALDEKIAALEARLSAPARHALGVAEARR